MDMDVLNVVLQVLGVVYVGFSALGAALPRHWRITGVLNRVAADIKGSGVLPPAQTDLRGPKAPDRASSLNASLFVFGLSALTGIGCHPAGTLNWPKAVECLPPVESVIGSVAETLLGGGSPKQALEDLARVHGTQTIVCAVERLRSDWTAPGAAASPERLDGVKKAEEFLRDVDSKPMFGG